MTPCLFMLICIALYCLSGFIGHCVHKGHGHTYVPRMLPAVWETPCALVCAVFFCTDVACRPVICFGLVWRRACAAVHMALPLASPPPQRRLRGKTPLAWVANGQVPLPAPLELLDEAKPDARRQAYLVTFPFPKQPRSATGEVFSQPYT